jgi:hypothetical protein
MNFVSFLVGGCPKQQVSGQLEFSSEYKGRQGQARNVVRGCPVSKEEDE